MSDTFVQTIKILEVITGETPPSGYVGLYAKDGNLYQIDSSGVSTLLPNTGGAGAQQFYVQVGAVPTTPVGVNVLDYFVQYQVNGTSVTPYIWEPD